MLYAFMGVKIMNNLSPLPPFVGALINSYPSVFVEGMSYDEILNKIKGAVNEVIKTVNDTIENFEELSESFAELKKCIDDYFNGLDVQDEINNKLDAMIENGQFSNIVNEYLFNDMQKQLDEKSDKSDIEKLSKRIDNIVAASGSGSSAELQDVRTDVNGKVWPDAGDAVRAVGAGEAIKNGAIGIEKLNFPYVLTDKKVIDNFVRTNGKFVTASGEEDENASYLLITFEREAEARAIFIPKLINYAPPSEYNVISFYKDDVYLSGVQNSKAAGLTYPEFFAYIPNECNKIKISHPKYNSLKLPSYYYYMTDTYAQFVNETSAIINAINGDKGVYTLNSPGYNIGSQYTAGFACEVSAIAGENIWCNVLFKTSYPVNKIQVDLYLTYEDGTNRKIPFEDTYLVWDKNNLFSVNVCPAIDTSVYDSNYTKIGVIIQPLSYPGLNPGDTETLILSASICGIVAEVKPYQKGNVFYTDSFSLYQPNSDNPLYKKRLGFMGDSLTATYYKTEQESWPYLIAKRNNCVYFNYGISGNPLSVQPDCMANRVLNMDKNLDYIMVMGGANDYNIGAPIGENDDNDISTFKGAINVCIDRLIKNYPAKKILFATTYQRTDDKSDQKFADAMLEVCALRNIPCIDNYRESGVQMTNPYWMKVCGPKGDTSNKHLNAKGDAFVSTLFESKLKSI